MTPSQTAAANAARIAALPRLEAEAAEIELRLAAAKKPADRDTLQRQFSERLAHLKFRISETPQTTAAPAAATPPEGTALVSAAENFAPAPSAPPQMTNAE